MGVSGECVVCVGAVGGTPLSILFLARSRGVPEIGFSRLLSVEVKKPCQWREGPCQRQAKLKPQAVPETDARQEGDEEEEEAAGQPRAEYGVASR